jgi:hypothetical protein
VTTSIASANIAHNQARNNAGKASPSTYHVDGEISTVPLSALNALIAPIVYTTPTAASSLLPGISLEQAWDVL